MRRRALDRRLSLRTAEDFNALYTERGYFDLLFPRDVVKLEPWEPSRANRS